MIELEFGFRKARVWLQELPAITYVKIDEVTASVETRVSEISGTRYAAIELFIPLGGRAAYGLLGARYDPDPSAQQLAIRVDVTGDKDSSIEWARANVVDYVRAGLPMEFTQGVIDGAIEAKDTIGSGKLHFMCAAHGAVGSSHMMFNVLAKLVVNLLNVSEPFTPDWFWKLVASQWWHE